MEQRGRKFNRFTVAALQPSPSGVAAWNGSFKCPS